MGTVVGDDQASIRQFKNAADVAEGPRDHRDGIAERKPDDLLPGGGNTWPPPNEDENQRAVYRGAEPTELKLHRSQY